MTTNAAGCWFWIDCQVPEDKRKVSPLCSKCREEKHPGVGSYWNFADGCGPWDIVCQECHAILHKHVDPETALLEEIGQDIDALFSESYDK